MVIRLTRVKKLEHNVKIGVDMDMLGVIYMELLMRAHVLVRSSQKIEVIIGRNTLLSVKQEVRYIINIRNMQQVPWKSITMHRAIRHFDLYKSKTVSGYFVESNVFFRYSL